MRIDAAVVRIRRRNVWQALDAGIPLARRWYGELLALWLTGALFLLPLPLALARQAPDRVLFFCFWFLHPLLDSLLMLWAGRALFAEEKPSRRETLKGFGARCSVRLLWRLCRYRLHPLRPFAYAVLLLEAPAPDRIASRIALLGRGRHNSAILLAAGLTAALLLTAGAVLAGFLFIPEELRRFSLEDLDSPAGRLLVFGVYAVISGLLAPFIMTGGFMLYLSRRVELEAWDIELGFRNLEQKLREEKA